MANNPEKTDKNDDIVNLLIDHPKGQKARETAREITNIMFDLRSAGVFDVVFFDRNPAMMDKLKINLIKFRKQAAELVKEPLPQDADELYYKIVLTLVARQIDRSL